MWSKSSTSSQPPGFNAATILDSARSRLLRCPSSKRACTRSNSLWGRSSVVRSCRSTRRLGDFNSPESVCRCQSPAHGPARPRIESGRTGGTPLARLLQRIVQKIRVRRGLLGGHARYTPCRATIRHVRQYRVSGRSAFVGEPGQPRVPSAPARPDLFAVDALELHAVEVDGPRGAARGGVRPLEAHGRAAGLARPLRRRARATALAVDALRDQLPVAGDPTFVDAGDIRRWLDHGFGERRPPAYPRRGTGVAGEDGRLLVAMQVLPFVRSEDDFEEHDVVVLKADVVVVGCRDIRLGRSDERVQLRDKGTEAGVSRISIGERLEWLQHPRVPRLPLRVEVLAVDPLEFD